MSSIYSGMDDGAVQALLERSYRGPERGRAAALVLGGVTITCAVLGIAYNACTLTHVLGGGADPEVTQLVAFRLAFGVMTAVCLGCYFALIFGGLQLIRRRSHSTLLLAGVWLFESVYLGAVSASWLLPGVGMSIAAATGVANGGLMIQVVILLPLWGPILALWLRRRLT